MTFVSDFFRHLNFSLAPKMDSILYSSIISCVILLLMAHFEFLRFSISILGINPTRFIPSKSQSVVFTCRNILKEATIVFGVLHWNLDERKLPKMVSYIHYSAKPNCISGIKVSFNSFFICGRISQEQNQRLCSSL